ncbi:MAG: hypothetical protein IJ436_04275 [Bacteroidaceae bacterium]|nr:hypothetical protein [Bacteroidaceae bacterium]
MIRPSNELLRKRAPGRFERAKVSLYRFLLKRLLRTYRHYAIFDTIIIDGERIKIVHEYRDWEFEKELIRNRIEFKPKMRAVSFPIVERKSRTKRHFGYFRFNNMLSVSVGGKELFVNHDDAHSIDGAIACKVRLNSSDDNISQSIIEILSAPVTATSQKGKSTTPANKGRNAATGIVDKPSAGTKKVPKNIFGRDRDILPITPQGSARPEMPPPVVEDEEPPRRIEKKGFEIDTTF